MAAAPSAAVLSTCPVCREPAVSHWERLKAALSTVARCGNCGAGLCRRSDTFSHVTTFAAPVVIVFLLMAVGLNFLAALITGIAATFALHYIGPLKPDDTDPITVHLRTRKKLRQAGRSRRRKPGA
jgi:uncharacterized paraquat-inducible protein A